MARQRSQECPVDMTPMIDVVFQLIIFFIVTITMEQEKNEDIVLPDSRHGPLQEQKQDALTVIEVDRRGWISMHGAKLSKIQLRNMMESKRRRMGRSFPILIRGDFRARHEDIRAVMDICTGIGIWKINFAAIKEKKT